MALGLIDFPAKKRKPCTKKVFSLLFYFMYPEIIDIDRTVADNKYHLLSYMTAYKGFPQEYIDGGFYDYYFRNQQFIIYNYFE